MEPVHMGGNDDGLTRQPAHRGRCRPGTSAPVRARLGGRRGRAATTSLLLLHAQGVPTGGYRTNEVLPSWEQWNEVLHTAGSSCWPRLWCSPSPGNRT